MSRTRAHPARAAGSGLPRSGFVQRLWQRAASADAALAGSYALLGGHNVGSTRRRVSASSQACATSRSSREPSRARSRSWEARRHPRANVHVWVTRLAETARLSRQCRSRRTRALQRLAKTRHHIESRDGQEEHRSLPHEQATQTEPVRYHPTRSGPRARPGRKRTSPTRCLAPQLKTRYCPAQHTLSIGGGAQRRPLHAVGRPPSDTRSTCIFGPNASFSRHRARPRLESSMPRLGVRRGRPAT